MKKYIAIETDPSYFLQLYQGFTLSVAAICSQILSGDLQFQAN